MAYTDIDKSDDYFNTKLYTGDGTSPKSITGVGFQPDWVWVKRRNGTTPHVLYDAVRGTGKQLISNDNSAEATNNQYGYISAFESDGYEVTEGSTSITRLNGSGGTYVAWNWLAGGTASSNTDGSITSNVSANTTSGFSIVSYTGNGTSGATVGHGISTPKAIFVKNRTDSGSNWMCYHAGVASDAETDYIELNTTIAAADYTGAWNDTAPTSSVFSIGNDNNVNGSGNSMIAYCFAEKQGFSKFGSYTGNGSSNGTFVYTGFKPAWVMFKRSNNSESWYMHDNKRDTFNASDKHLLANASNSENAQEDIDLLSNGWKIRSSDSGYNASGDTYIYMAFAENPFVTSTGIAGTAR